MRLSGFDAIEFADKAGLSLHKRADSIDEAASGLSIAEAEAIADEHPELIWVEVPAEEYYGEMRNMEPGTQPAHAPRLAGQRHNELLPDQHNPPRAEGHDVNSVMSAGSYDATDDGQETP